MHTDFRHLSAMIINIGALSAVENSSVEHHYRSYTDFSAAHIFNIAAAKLSKQWCTAQADDYDMSAISPLIIYDMPREASARKPIFTQEAFLRRRALDDAAALTALLLLGVE